MREECGLSTSECLQYHGRYSNKWDYHKASTPKPPQGEQDWVWMPHPAHFVGADNCHFRLATYVGGYIVSTVGEYKPHLNEPGFEQIGVGRLYETMVFESRESDEPGHCEACPYFIDVARQVDMEPYNDAKAAFDGHHKLCRKWAVAHPNTTGEEHEPK